MEAYEKRLDQKYTKNLEKCKREPLFLKGKEQVKGGSVYGFKADMSLVQMKELLLKGYLSLKEKGALSHYIGKKNVSSPAKMLESTAGYCKSLRQAGSVFDRAAPRLYLAKISGTPSSGNEIFNMAEVLAGAGEKGVHKLMDEMFLAAMQKRSYGLPKNVQGVVSRYETNDNKVLSAFKLPEIVSQLKGIAKTSLFELKSDAPLSPSMMVGCTVKGEGNVRRYYFYDPIVGIFAFDDEKSLSRALKQHLVDGPLGYAYGAVGKKADLKFRLTELDLSKVPVQLGEDVTVE